MGFCANKKILQRIQINVCYIRYFISLVCYTMFQILILEELNISKLGRRELFFFNITDKNIETVIDEIKSTLTSQKYAIDVHSGKYGINVIIEVSGPDEEGIRQIDFILSAKVLEICEKRNIGVHLIEPIQIY